MQRSLFGMMTMLVCYVAFGDVLQIKAPGYKVEQLVKPSVFHGVHGLTFDKDDKLYAGSVVGESIYRVDIVTGKAEVVVGSPEGMADDLVFLPDGTLVWTSINQSTVRARKGNGPIRVIGEKLPGANSINYRKSDGRLFMGQVFAGDGLWELDVTGAKPPRNILKDIGGLNGFDFGSDGWIYGPLWFKHQVVKINPDTGELKVVADGFDTPAAANFDSKGNLYVLDTAVGTVNRVDIKTGGKTIVAKLKPSLDNLAIDSKDRVFVTNMADNGIQEVNVENGRLRSVTKGSLATPVSLSAVADGKRDLIYVADIFAYRAIDSNTGRITDIERSHAAGSHIDYPVGVSANDAHVLVANFNGTLQKYGRRDGKLLQEWKGVGASGVLELDGDALLLAQGGTLTRIDPKGERKQIAGELGTIQSIARRGNEVYVADVGGGRVLRVNLSNGEKKVVTNNLQVPITIALQKDGDILAIEFGKQRLVRIDPTNGKITEVAAQLPIGVHGSARPDIPIGLTVGSDGAIYIASDVENSVYKLTKQ